MANPAYVPSDKELAQAEAEKRWIDTDQKLTVAALNEGDIPMAVSRLQWKVNRQRLALQRLQARVINQRFVLHLMNDLGRALTQEEWAEHRGRLNPDKRDQLAEDMKFIGW